MTSTTATTFHHIGAAGSVGPAADRQLESSTEDSPVSGARRTTPMLVELDREWQRLRRRPAALRTVRTWSGDDTFNRVVGCVRSLDDIVAATQPCAGIPGAGEALLRRLVELAATQELAGRIVLQRLLPGLISRSRRWMGRGGSADPTDIAIGAAWIAVRRFDVSTRPRHVAPALIADALWIGFRRDARKRVESEIPVPGSVLGVQPAPPRETDPIIALARTVHAAALAGVRSSDLDLIRTILVAGGPTRAARECAVTVRTIRNRRDVAARRIRRALGPDWADWSDPLVAA